MKKKVLLLLQGMLCVITFYSCSKNKAPDSELVGKEAHIESNTARCGCQPADTSIFDPTCLVAPNAQWKVLGEGYSFTEGPAVDKKGNIFFTDQPNDKIYKWSAINGAITPFLTGTGRSNGMAFDKDGN